jgi:kinesin family protein 2/24
MIATISPASSSADHTINTLRYADRVKERLVGAQQQQFLAGRDGDGHNYNPANDEYEDEDEDALYGEDLEEKEEVNAFEQNIKERKAIPNNNNNNNNNINININSPLRGNPKQNKSEKSNKPKENLKFADLRQVYLH